MVRLEGSLSALAVGITHEIGTQRLAVSDGVGVRVIGRLMVVLMEGTRRGQLVDVSLV